MEAQNQDDSLRNEYSEMKPWLTLLKNNEKGLANTFQSHSVVQKTGVIFCCFKKYGECLIVFWGRKGADFVIQNTSVADSFVRKCMEWSCPAV